MHRLLSNARRAADGSPLLVRLSWPASNWVAVEGGLSGTLPEARLSLGRIMSVGAEGAVG